MPVMRMTPHDDEPISALGGHPVTQRQAQDLITAGGLPRVRVEPPCGTDPNRDPFEVTEFASLVKDTIDILRQSVVQATEGELSSRDMAVITSGMRHLTRLWAVLVAAPSSIERT